MAFKNLTYFLYIRVRPHWGFVLRRIPFSKSRPALDFIPPTTMIGALSYPLIKILGDSRENVVIKGVEVSRSEVFRQIFRSLHATRPQGELYSDLQKIYFFDKRRKISKSDAVALEKFYGVGEIEFVYLIDSEKAKEVLGQKWQNMIEAAAWGIVRIGQKEGVVSVEEVNFGVAELCEEAITRYYFMSRHGSPKSGRYLIREVIDWTLTPIGEYSRARRAALYIPDGEVEVKLTDDGAIYRAGPHGCVVGPK